MTNILIMAANGQIARIVEERILFEQQFQDIHLTLFLRNKQRLARYQNNPRVTLIEGDLLDSTAVATAINNQDLVFVAVVDHDSKNRITQNVVTAMKQQRVNRVLFTNVLGLYHEVGGEFGRWNEEYIGRGLPSARHSDQILKESGLNYTTLRLPWLNDRPEIKYQITTQDQPYLGVSGSRQSIADAVLQIMADPNQYSYESIGIADPDTQGLDRPVY